MLREGAFSLSFFASGKIMGRNVVAIGLDLVDLERIDKAFSRSGKAFAARLCTPGELEYCFARENPVPSLAARFAAKEAVSKALGTGIGVACGLRDVEVVMSPAGRPEIVLHGAARQTAEGLGIAGWSLSLTHSRTAAAAVALAFA